MFEPPELWRRRAETKTGHVTRARRAMGARLSGCTCRATGYPVLSVSIEIASHDTPGRELSTAIACSAVPGARLPLCVGSGSESALPTLLPKASARAALRSEDRRDVGAAMTVTSPPRRHTTVPWSLMTTVTMRLGRPSDRMQRRTPYPARQQLSVGSESNPAWDCATTGVELTDSAVRNAWPRRGLRPSKGLR